ncbi:MAG: hypothetical protein JXB50_00540 [Spirochaetes bacterium]|nr:hypothetical protein [Spirochaetota bacterium]
MRIRKIIYVLLLVLLILTIGFSCKEEKKDLMSDDKIVEALSERIKEGGTIKDVLPPTIVLVFGTMIPISAIIGFFVFISLLIKHHNKKILALIEKGIYEPKPVNFKWEILLLFIGVILAFVGPGVSLTVIGFYGIETWAVMTGMIPFCLGLALIIFYIVYKKIKK